MGNNSSSVTTVYKTLSGVKVKRFEFEWKIEKFASISQRNGQCINSPNFKTDEEGDWQVLVYPEGFNERSKGYISLWIRRSVTNVEKVVGFTCVIEDTKGKAMIKRTDKRTLTLESTLGWTTFCHRKCIMDCDTLEEDLTLKFMLDFFDEAEIANPALDENDSILNLCQSMKKMLADAPFSDLSVVANHALFPVHKGVLCARSEVFHTMLHSKLERSSTKITINDISEDAMNCLLRFIYTNELPDLKLDLAKELYNAAEKYDLSDLKDLCSKVLSLHLEVDTVLDILLLADRYRDWRLKRTSVEFIVNHINDIHGRSEWVAFITANPDLANIVVKNLTKAGSK